MAAKTDSTVVLPLDTGNTGKTIRTKRSVVGANTVEEYYFIESSERNTLGQYKFSTGAQAIPAAVHTGAPATATAAPTGFIFLVNPLSNSATGIHMAIDRVTLKQNFSTTLAVDLIAPIIRASKFTFTGTLSAAQITPAKRKTADAAPTCSVSLLSTGLTVTNNATVYEWLGQTMDLVTGGAGHWQAQTDEWNPADEDDELVLDPGEGLVIWSTLAVTTANRKLIINGAWFEFQ
jgi:hypothetical protein